MSKNQPTYSTYTQIARKDLVGAQYRRNRHLNKDYELYNLFLYGTTFVQEQQLLIMPPIDYLLACKPTLKGALRVPAKHFFKKIHSTWNWGQFNRALIKKNQSYSNNTCSLF